MRDRGARGGSRGRELAFAGLHLLVLCSFALAQPLFDLLGRNATFFAARGSTSGDVLTFALALTFGPPLVLLGVEGLVGLVSDVARRALHLAFVAVLSALVVMQALTRIDGVRGAVFVVLGGICVAAAYARFAPVRSIATVLAPVPLVFLALFLFGTPVEKIAFAEDAHASTAPIDASAPVVVVVLDEFPVVSLFDGRGRIDARRFPGFAALARGSTWFPNTTTSAGQTSLAVPSILTGLAPDDGNPPPVAAEYPHNLFTWLGGSYRTNVTEAVTRLCPNDICPASTLDGFGGRIESLASDLSVVYGHLVLPSDLGARLPSIAQSWGDFSGGEESAAPRAGNRFVQLDLFPAAIQDRAQKFEAFVRSVLPTRRPQLSYLHVLLPHYGWVYFPDGRRYTADGTIAGLTDDRWGADSKLVEEAWRRHLLQVGLVDRMIGRLVRHLTAVGLWKRSLVVVTADHGVSFVAGQPRRAANPATAPGIVFVPLFVKAPGQTQGRTVETHVRTVDILPTMAGALGSRLPWAVDGHDALAPRFRPDDGVRFVRTSGDPTTFGYASLLARRSALERRQARLFGTGSWAGTFRAGPHAELVGRRASVARSDPSLRFEGPLAARYDPRSGSVPALVHGHLVGPGAEAGIDLAVAVNGRIEAVTRSYFETGGPVVSALVPEAAIHPGRNAFAVYRVERNGTLVRLSPSG